MADTTSFEGDAALQPATLNTNPGPAYATDTRAFQGIPGIERSPNGRLWAVWYSGGPGEGPENYVLLGTSADDGHTWQEPVLVIDPPGPVRAFDPVLWHDPQGRLWLFWAQSEGKFDGRAGVWASHTDESDAERPTWSPPQRIAHGVMMNKPTVLGDGTWALAIALWEYHQPHRPDLAHLRYSNVIASSDGGATWRLRGQADLPQRAFDEHMLVERRDGSLWMLIRAQYGIGESVSTDGGRTWSPGQPTTLGGPNSRFHIRRLTDERLLLINHANDAARSHLTAWLSADDGVSWQGGLLLDERLHVSYPDGVQAPDGRIYAIYDRERHGAREILMAVFRAEDVLAGDWISPDARSRCVISEAGD